MCPATMPQLTAAGDKLLQTDSRAPRKDPATMTTPFARRLTTAGDATESMVPATMLPLYRLILQQMTRNRF